MDSSLIHTLLQEFDKIVEEKVYLCSNIEDQHKLLMMAEAFRKQFEERLCAVSLKNEEGIPKEQILMLQSDIIELENKAQTLSNALEEYRNEAQKEIQKREDLITEENLITMRTDSHKHSSFRKGLQDSVTRDVNQIVDMFEKGFVQEVGNEIRRTQRTIRVKDKDKVLSTMDRVIASVN